jgi:hypothetical protein
MTELRRTQEDQPSQPMSDALFDRFTGLTHVRAELAGHPDLAGRVRAAVVDEGKHAGIVRQALREVGARLAADEAAADVLVIGTLSPGPMLDARESRRAEDRPVLLPWQPSTAFPAPVLRKAV